MNDIRCVSDANIWIDTCHCDHEQTYLNVYSTVGFVEQVHNEIVKFKNSNGKFNYIHQKYVDNSDLYRVLTTKELGDMEVQFISQLRGKGFLDIDNSNKVIKNLGEYASLYYAYHMGIPFLHTTDLQFLHDEQSRMPGINMLSWSDICDEIFSDADEKIRMNKLIEQKKAEMKVEKEKFEKNKQSKLTQRLARYQNAVNSRRNN